MARLIKRKKQVQLFPFTRKDLIIEQAMQQELGWAITAFNLPESWKYTQGEGVTVAVLDTGCDLNHIDLVDNLLPGKNFINVSEPPQDDACHGTHITGIICAQNNNLGVVGVAPKAKVMPIKVLDKKGSGDMQTVAKGIRYAADKKVDFILMSLGSPNPIPIVQDAMKYAASKGSICWCAAGNAGKTRQIFYPAAYPEAIGIGAIDENFERANFSCTGPDLDFVAPGVSILSTVPENWYAILSGTSMSNPFACGVACLLLSYKRKKNLDIKLDTAKDYIEFLKKYTIHINDPTMANKQIFEGFGILDPRKLEEWIKSKE
jgi:major intracellular serine protease